MQEINIWIFLEILLEGFDGWVTYEIPKINEYLIEISIMMK